MSEARESRPIEDEAAPEESDGSEHQSTTQAQRTEALDEAKVHRKHVRVAHEFVGDHLGDLLYVVGIGWHHWDGARWAVDLGDRRAKAAVMKTIRDRWYEAMGDKELVADLSFCSTASGVRGVLELAASLPGMGAVAAEMDADPYLLNCANGTLDLQSMELRPHEPADRITKVTRAAYRPGHVSPEWAAFLERILPDPEVRDYLQRFFGLALVGKVLEHIFTIATGSGRNGKGVTYSSALFALGDYAQVADPSLLETVKANPNAPSPAFFDLRGRRLVVLSETETKVRMAAALLKRLTGGDPIKARALRQDPIQFDPSHIFFMVTNHLPELPSKDSDPAVWARIRVVPFDEVIPKAEQDPRLPEKLELAADGILTWMIEGLAEYWKTGLAEPKAVLAKTDEYASEQDDIRRFLDEECHIVVNDDDGATTTQLHNAYKEWCVAEGIFRRHQLGRGMFGQAMEALGYPSVKKREGMVHQGVHLGPPSLDISELPPGVLTPAASEQSVDPGLLKDPWTDPEAMAELEASGAVKVVRFDGPGE